MHTEAGFQFWRGRRVEKAGKKDCKKSRQQQKASATQGKQEGKAATGSKISKRSSKRSSKPGVRWIAVGIYQPSQMFFTACPNCPDPELRSDSPPNGGQRGAAGEADQYGDGRGQIG